MITHDDLNAICQELNIDREARLLLAILNKQKMPLAEQSDFEKRVSVQAAELTIINQQSEAKLIDDMRVFYKENFKNETCTVREMFASKVISYEADILADSFLKRTMDNKLLNKRFGDVCQEDFYVWNDDQVETHMQNDIVEIGMRAGEPVFLSTSQMNKNNDQVRKQAAALVIAQNPEKYSPQADQVQTAEANPVVSSESPDQVAVTEVKASVEAPNYADTFRAWAKALNEKQMQVAKQ